MRPSNSSSFVEQMANEMGIPHETIIFQYMLRKTKASDRDSKARRSLGNLYALYVLAEDYYNGNDGGSDFTKLMGRIKSMPFGARLQNHPLDNRLNDEVKRRYAASDEMLPVQVADLGGGKKGRKISTLLLSEFGMNPQNSSHFILCVVQQYISIIDDNQNAYLREIEKATTKKDIATAIGQAFKYESDARLFEIVSFAILHIHYIDTTIEFTLDGAKQKRRLELYRTGRTNANDGGIDFVLLPLGRFFQVTETLDFKKFFLDFEKINRYPLSFVIKTDSSPKEVINKIFSDAEKEHGEKLAKVYISLFEEIFTLNELRKMLEIIKSDTEKVALLKKLVIDCFKLEFGLLD